AANPPWAVNTGTAATGTAGVSRAPVTQRTTGAKPSRAPRAILLLDNVRPDKLRVTPADVERRAGLERRKLREMIEFCYTEYCYRAAILDYFGDRHHARNCGSCGNCNPQSAAKAPLARAEILGEARPSVRNRKGIATLSDVSAPRDLSDDENLRVRKMLACASRMKGRFGKTVLAGTLRGSAAKNVMQAHLNELSTYGLLSDMRQDDILLYIDALCVAGCLRVSAGEYPTVSITELGQRVMREQERIQLALPG
ncbi:MAG TPA: RQC domain-containing protein, partial [Pyrinomonadaceae bacterium]|nr:RQC domain-containing protein [Pyrinomonadaceae bacterium]